MARELMIDLGIPSTDCGVSYNTDYSAQGYRNATFTDTEDL